MKSLSRLKPTLSFAAALIFVTGLSSTQHSDATPKPSSPAPEHRATFDSGMTKQKVRFFDDFKIANGASLAGRKIILIEPTEVTFSKTWLRQNKNSTSKRYQDNIKTTYGKLVTSELQKALLETSGANVQILTGKSVSSVEKPLRIKPYLHNLSIYAPDDHGPMKKSWVNAAGIATFKLEVTDSNTNLPIAYFRDRKETSEKLGPNNMDRANRATNYHDFKVLIRKWSKATAERFAQR